MLAQHTTATRWTVLSEATNSTNAVTGKAWLTQASATTAVVEFMNLSGIICVRLRYLISS